MISLERAAAILAEGRKHDAAMTPGEWHAGRVDVDRLFFPDPNGLGGPMTPSVLLRMNAHFANFRSDVAGIAWLRNHAAELLALAADGSELHRIVRNAAPTIQLALAHLAGGDSPPLRADTTARFAQALATLENVAERVEAADRVARQFTARRPDGWPRCPGCGEDELYATSQPPTETAIAGCYRCSWKPTQGPYR